MRAPIYLNSRQDKMWRRRRFTSCDFCPPHRGENGKWKKHPVKKAYQLRRKKATTKTYKPILHYPWND